MLHSKSLVTVISLFLLFFLSSCKKNDLVSPNNISPQKQLTKIVQDANNYSTLAYANNKLSQYQSVSDSKISNLVTLNYNGQNKPQTEYYTFQTEELLKKYYYGSSSNLDSTDIMLKDSTNNYNLDGHLKYYYNSLNQLIKIEQYDTKYNLLFTTDYSYDGNGNISERQLYSSNGFNNEVTTMKYDDKINPWYNLKGWFHYDISMSKNNLISYSTTNSNNNIANAEATYNYTYDSDGYPVSVNIVVTTNNVKNNITEKFEYQ
ncbi:MAG: hypothetical protein ACYDEE_16220 [Ignavibacteriaceae bacterium]